MEQKIVLANISILERFIRFQIRIFNKKLDETVEDQLYPAVVSGVVQGQVSQFEILLYESGHDPKEYWESERGRLLNALIAEFKYYCRLKMLYRLSGEKWN